jgi:hypothetical protein
MRVLNAFRVLLDLHALDADEKVRADVVGALLKQAPQSQLYKNNPTIQAELANLSTTYDTFTQSGTKAAASKAQHVLDIAAHDDARVANNKSINMLRRLSENGATSLKDLQEMAFVGYQGRPPAPPIEPPDVVMPKLGKKGSGKAEAVVQETGRTRQRYAAQWSPDPITPTSWEGLPGYGKSRKLSGKSGTSVWVRFALIRSGKQSEWSVPILITYP